MGKNLEVLKKLRKLIHTEFTFYFSVFERRRMENIFSIKPNDILIFFIFIEFDKLLRWKYLLMFFDFDTVRKRCHFAFCLQMFF